MQANHCLAVPGQEDILAALQGFIAVAPGESASVQTNMKLQRKALSYRMKRLWDVREKSFEREL